MSSPPVESFVSRAGGEPLLVNCRELLYISHFLSVLHLYIMSLLTQRPLPFPNRLSVFMLTHTKHPHTRRGETQRWNQALKASLLVCYCVIGATDGRQLGGFPLELRWRQSLVCGVFSFGFWRENKVNVTHSHSILRLVFYKCVSNTLSNRIVHRRRSLPTVLKTMSNSPWSRPVCDLYFSSMSPVEQYCITL